MQLKHKIIIAITATVVVIVIGYKLVVPSGPTIEQQRVAIERAITHDKGLVHQLQEDAGFFGNLFGDADAERNYVARLRQVPLENCPADFAKAYKAHIAAWESRNHDDIARTWNQVVYIAYEYGVKVD